MPLLPACLRFPCPGLWWLGPSPFLTVSGSLLVAAAAYTRMSDSHGPWSWGGVYAQGCVNPIQGARNSQSPLLSMPQAGLASQRGAAFTPRPPESAQQSRLGGGQGGQSLLLGSREPVAGAENKHGLVLLIHILSALQGALH